MQHISFLLAGLVVISAAVGADECNWRSLNNATIHIRAIEGGYQANFTGPGNCSIIASDQAPLDALEQIMGQLWELWAEHENDLVLREEQRAQAEAKAAAKKATVAPPRSTTPPEPVTQPEEPILPEPTNETDDEQERPPMVEVVAGEA